MHTDSLSTLTSRPFLKWAGGKRKLLNYIIPRLGPLNGRYFEPFLGAGSVLLSLPTDLPKSGNDINGELINAWISVRDNPAALLETLRTFTNSREEFELVRNLDRDPNWKENTDSILRAARTIYLNKTCFNGLYRVNSRGEFNVPFGNYKSPRVADDETIFEVSRILNTRDRTGCTPVIANSNYKQFVESAKPGDVVYFDPPYAPLSETASFVAYSSGGFGQSDQVQLRDTAAALMERGVRVLISNSDTNLINDLYTPKYGFKKTRVEVARPIAAKTSSRKSVGELLIQGIPK
jgi:DNA adenine methylase